MAPGELEPGGAERALFGPSKPVYLNFILKSFQKQLAYKFEYFVGVFNGLLFIFVFTSLWSSIYANPQAAASTNFDRSSIISYAVFAMLFRISMTMEDSHTANRVRTGAITMDFIKPVNYFLMLFSEALGQSLFHWFTRVLPILFFSLLVFDVSLPKDAGAYLITLVAWTLGYTIMFMINFLFSLLAFWFIETFSFQLMKFGLFTLFSGGIAPIDFFPHQMRPFMDIMPFQYILYVPTSLFIGHIKGFDALWLVALQVLWVVILGLASFKMWSAAQRKLVTQGG